MLPVLYCPLGLKYLPQDYVVRLGLYPQSCAIVKAQGYDYWDVEELLGGGV